MSLQIYLKNFDKNTLNSNTSVMFIHYMFLSIFQMPIDTKIEGSGSAEKNKKRDIRDRYLINERYREERVEVKNNFARRGDIPILSGDCDGKWVSFYFYPLYL